MQCIGAPLVSRRRETRAAASTHPSMVKRYGPYTASGRAELLRQGRVYAPKPFPTRDFRRESAETGARSLGGRLAPPRPGGSSLRSVSGLLLRGGRILRGSCGTDCPRPAAPGPDLGVLENSFRPPRIPIHPPRSAQLPGGRRIRSGGDHDRGCRRSRRFRGVGWRFNPAAFPRDPTADARLPFPQGAAPSDSPPADAPSAALEGGRHLRSMCSLQ